MSRWRKIMTLELFRDSDNSDTIDDLQAMTFMGMFDNHGDDLF